MKSTSAEFNTLKNPLDSLYKGEYYIEKLKSWK
jgi:hypothetical protein